MQLNSIILVYLLSVLSTLTYAIQDEEADNENSYIDVHQHPKNGFSCEGKKVGEYYSDLSTNCQLYYVCLPNAQLKLSPTSFACPNTTRFNQATRVCSPADQVYCAIAERFYENVHGNIDSKDHRPNEYLGPDFDKTPWQINRQKVPIGKPLVPMNLNAEPEYRVQTERPRPAPRTLPKIEQPITPAKSDSPLHTSFALTFNNNPQNARVVARTRASTTATQPRRGNTIDILPNHQPSTSNRFKPNSNVQNSRSRLPTNYSIGGRNSIVSTVVTTPSTTTTTTTTTTTAAPPLITDVNAPPKNDPKSADYIYDYVEYDAPAANGQPSSTNRKPPTVPALPALPALADAQPNRNKNSHPVTNSNIGSLFGNVGGAINPQPPRISPLSNSVRPAPRNQPAQPNSLKYFNSNPFSNNPFSSNPFASNPFSNSNGGGSLIRQKRENSDDDQDTFSCHDKLPNLSYADTKKCEMFHICLQISKNKFKDYQLFCESGQGFNQFTLTCEPLDKFDCKRSKDYYLYNKSVNMHQYMKNKARINKQLAGIKN